MIVPRPGCDNSNVKYRVHYDRLSHAVVGLVRAYLLRNQRTTTLREALQGETPGNLHATLSQLRNTYIEVEQRKEEVLGCQRFIAALSCVDGVVLLDQRLAVHGFGVELRTDSNLDEAFMAGDAEAHSSRLRCVPINQFGTRHRAMMRYCFQYPGSLGFAVSQDGGIQAMMRIGEQLTVWENIAVALALTDEELSPEESRRPLVLRRFGIRSYR